MRSYDLTPLLRSTVGFDRMARLLDGMTRLDEQAVGYPPYNIEKLGEDDYRITMAVAGFGEDELEITVSDGNLVVRGETKEKAEPQEVTYLHRGIASRTFERRFDLAEFIKVTGAKLENGLLHIALAREVPEAKKPRTVQIESAATKTKAIEQKAA
ncbi:Hsp20 family protein [Limibacillus sp. MBR-115]|jgi:molecular chaperone IbpA|uniref:Hsp20 family protein n=1 Tax=Limibacillus sp. MBR-115 TaxID=3156465 RepID=UPI003396A955